jgi:protein SCO1
MRRMRKPRSRRQLAAIFLGGLLGLYGGYWVGNEYARRGFQPQALTRLEQPAPLEGVTLLDHHGAPFTAERLRGGWSLLLPGYLQDGATSADLLGLATRVHNRLVERPQLQREFRVLLLSLDPAADTPERLRDLLRPYGQSFLGLTGDADAVQRFARQLGWVALRVEDGHGGYRVDHSTTLALLNPDAALVGVFTGLLDPATIAADIQQLAALR